MPRRSSTPPDKPAKKANRRGVPSGLKTAGFYRSIDLAKPFGLTGLGLATLYEMIKAGRFPAPVKLSGRVSGWPVPAVNAWLAERGALPAVTEEVR